ncbi:MAG: SpoIIE family protein phosphatase [Pseudomonadota bacterium]
MGLDRRRNQWRRNRSALKKEGDGPFYQKGRRLALGAREEEQRAILAAIFNAAVDGLIAIDEQGDIMLFNPGAERLFGVNAAEVVGRNVNRLMPQPLAEQHDYFIQRYLDGGPPRVLGLGREVQGLGSDGRLIPLHLSLVEIRALGKRLFVAILRDISDIKEAQRQLEQAKTASEFLAEELTQTLQVSEELRQAMDEGLRAAADLQQGLLPKHPPRLSNIQFAWEFLPSETLGGDLFNSFFIDDRRLGLYITDVSGHGVPAALVTFSFAQTLTPQAGLVVARESDRSGGRTLVTPPARVLEELDRQFPVERFDKTFTAIYMVIDLVEGRLTYSNAGHPPGILIHNYGGMEHLDCGGPLIGLGSASFTQDEHLLQPGDRVVLLTDGVIDYENGRGEAFGLERLEEIILGSNGEPLAETFRTVLQALENFGEGMPPRDDVSLFGFEWLGEQ